eukprot:UN09217
MSEHYLQTKVKPVQVKEATKYIPWGWNYYASDIRDQLQLQREWTAYLNDDYPPIPRDESVFENGERCLVYFEGKAEVWHYYHMLLLEFY